MKSNEEIIKELGLDVVEVYSLTKPPVTSLDAMKLAQIEALDELYISISDYAKFYVIEHLTKLKEEINVK